MSFKNNKLIPNIYVLLLDVSLDAIKNVIPTQAARELSWHGEFRTYVESAIVNGATNVYPCIHTFNTSFKASCVSE
jgi:hypothetical protein